MTQDPRGHTGTEKHNFKKEIEAKCLLFLNNVLCRISYYFEEMNSKEINF